MADTSMGDGWWQASDLKWYPPDLHADEAHRARYAEPQPIPAPPPPISARPSEPPTTQFASIEDTLDEPHAAAQPPAPQRAPRAPQGTNSNAGARAWALVGGGIALLALGAVIFFAFSNGGDTDSTAEPQTDSAPAGADEPPPTGPLSSSTPDVTAEGSAGTPDDPARFGQVYGWPEWRGSIIDVIDADAAGLLNELDEPPPEGRTNIAVIYEATYLGNLLSSYEPFVLDAPSTTVFDTAACFLDNEKLEAIGVDSAVFQLVPGQTATLAACLEVASDAVEGIAIALDNVIQISDPVVFTSTGNALPALDPPATRPGERSFDTKPFGTELTDGDWSAAVFEVFDPVEEGVLSPFSDPPDDGHLFVTVVYQVTNSGEEDADFIPIRTSGLGTAVFEPFSDCFLDVDAMASRGIETLRFDLEAGRSAVLADCLEVPIEERDTFAVRLESFFSFDESVVLYSARD